MRPDYGDKWLYIKDIIGKYVKSDITKLKHLKL